MNKQHILDEIKRTAEGNGGTPLGKDRFLKESGIKVSDWYGKFWARWNDALAEAGYGPNKLNAPYTEEHIIRKYVDLVRSLGRVPVAGEVRLQQKLDPSFPSHNTIGRLGSKAQLLLKVADYCRRTGGLGEVIELCQTQSITTAETAETTSNSASLQFGFVYLFKAGKFYKIGRSNSSGRREYELAIQLPDKLTKVHEIRTDDPVGIEAYWHKRFESKHKNGEWYDLASRDVQAFRRRKFM